jgi:hypothetical protein
MGDFLGSQLGYWLDLLWFLGLVGLGICYIYIFWAIVIVLQYFV